MTSICAWTAIERLLVKKKSDLSEKVKCNFFQVAVLSILLYGCVKYSLAHNMRQGKNSHCAVKKVMRRKRLTYELHDSYFRSMMITPAIPKIADVTHPNGQ